MDRFGPQMDPSGFNWTPIGTRVVSGETRRSGRSDAPDDQLYREGLVSSQPAPGVQNRACLWQARRRSFSLRGPPQFFESVSKPYRSSEARNKRALSLPRRRSARLQRLRPRNTP